MGFSDFEGFASLLTRPDVGPEDRLLVCKTMAELCALNENATTMAGCPGVPQALADILSSTAGPRTDERHQAYAALCVTRCVSKCSPELITKWALTPGLVDGLSQLRKSPDQFVQISSLVALRMLLRCDDAVGSSRKLLRLKWRSALVESGSRGSSTGGSAHPSPGPPVRHQDEGDHMAEGTPQKQQQHMSDVMEQSATEIHHQQYIHRLLNEQQRPSVLAPHQEHIPQMEQQRLPPPSPSPHSVALTPFSSSRLGSVQRTHIQQQVEQQQQQHARSSQLAQQSHAHVATTPSQNRWDVSSASSTPSRPPPYVYKDFTTAKDYSNLKDGKDDVHLSEQSGVKVMYNGEGSVDRESSWASARETRPGSGYYGGSDQSRSPYSSGNSVGYPPNVGGGVGNMGVGNMGNMGSISANGVHFLPMQRGGHG